MDFTCKTRALTSLVKDIQKNKFSFNSPLQRQEDHHHDLGQMQMYVNYYDRYEKTTEEKPTVGILLCQEKSDALVELTLPENANIYASKYELYLPDKKLLQEKLKEWIMEEK